ncbi:MAG: hypothetical protein U0167_04105 [bacterium]
MTKSVACAVAAALPLVFAGCGKDSTTGPGNVTDIQVQATGFPALSQGDGVFELWISFARLSPSPPGLRHSTAASAGRFRVDAGGKFVSETGAPMVFAVDPASDRVTKLTNGKIAWQVAEDSFVTWEPVNDPELDDPNLPAIIAGSFLNGKATLTTGGDDALRTDFATLAGSFCLATPTTTSSSDETDGVWFAAPGGASASLTLATLPAGWTYQGWITRATSTSSLGVFTLADGADADSSGPTVAGQDHAGYAFPGSDFPTGAAGVDLRPGTVFVTVEPPEGADGAGPSFLRVLSASLSAAQAPGAAVPLARMSAFPTLEITIPPPNS